MLLIDVIVGEWMTFFMGTLASNENSAACLLLQTLLVDAFGPDYQPNEVYTLILRKVNLCLELGGICIVLRDAATGDLSRPCKHTRCRACLGTMIEMPHSFDRCDL